MRVGRVTTKSWRKAIDSEGRPLWAKRNYSSRNRNSKKTRYLARARPRRKRQRTTKKRRGRQQKRGKGRRRKERKGKKLSS